MKLLIAGITLLITTELFATIVPPNNLYIPVDLKGSYTTELEFNKVIDTVANLYTDSKIQVYKFWEDGTVNAYAEDIMGIKSVNFFGGFARLPEMTEDAFALVVCHEYGHHLGGAPRKNGNYSSWASAEGQADYFAVTKCLKRYFELMPLGQAIEELEQCENADDRQLCSRIAITGERLAQIFHMVEGNPNEGPSLMTPSQHMVEKTNKDQYPSNQCRTDTYLAAALCTVSTTSKTHPFFAEIGQCHSKNGDTEGLRPRCWFAP